MKKIGVLSALLIFTVFSCDKIEELKTIDLETVLDHSVNVNISETDPLTVNENFTVSALDDPEVEKNKEKIKEFTVKKVSYQIVSYSGAEGITLTGTVHLGNVSVGVEDVDLNTLYSSGATEVLELFETDLVKLANQLDKEQEISGNVTGEISGKPVAFTVKFMFDVGFRVSI